MLDQLIGGAGEAGVTYALAAGLLGFTPDSLLDEVVDAFAARDGGAVFGAVDKVIETGQDPRRFTEDLLRRLRDLVIIAAVPDAPASGLIDVPEDQAERLVAQAARFGRHDLSRAADLVADGLTELKGTTAPRLLLELICARVLLPGADDTEAGTGRAARPAGEADGDGGSPAERARSRPRPRRPRSRPGPLRPSRRRRPRPAGPSGPAPSRRRRPRGSPSRCVPHLLRRLRRPRCRPPAAGSGRVRAPPHRSEPRGSAWSTSAGCGPTSWPGQAAAPDDLDPAQPARPGVGLDDRRLTIGFNNPGARESFVAGSNDEILHQVPDRPDRSRPGGSTRSSTRPPSRARPPPPPASAAPAAEPAPAPARGPVAGTRGPAAPAVAADPAVRSALEPGGAGAPGASGRAPDDGATATTPTPTTLDTEQLLAQRLGAQLIEEIPQD